MPVVDKDVNLWVGWIPSEFGFYEMDPFDLAYTFKVGGVVNGQGQVVLDETKKDQSTNGNVYYSRTVQVDDGSPWIAFLEPLGGPDAEGNHWGASSFALPPAPFEQVTKLLYVDDWATQATASLQPMLAAKQFDQWLVKLPKIMEKLKGG